MQAMQNNEVKSKLRRVYESNVLYQLIANVSAHYSHPKYHFSGMPIDIFEQVILWLGKAKMLDEKEFLLQVPNIWMDVKCQYLESFPKMDENIDELVCTTLCVLKLCMDNLTGETVSGSSSYYKYSQQMALCLRDANPAWRSVYLSILSHRFLDKHSSDFKDWTIAYMTDKNMSYLTDNGELKTNVSKNGRTKERRKEVLFAMPGDKYEKDSPKTLYWKKCFLDFLNENIFSDKVIHTTKDNKVVNSLVAFHKYWVAILGKKLPTVGASYYRFLTEDCEIDCACNAESSVHTFIGEKIKKGKVEEHLQFQVNKHIREFMEKNELP